MQSLGDDGTGHSPIHGFAFDGYPFFGPYQAANTVAVSCWEPRDYSATSPTGCSDGTRSCQLNNFYEYTQGTKSVTSGPSLTGTVTSTSSNSISTVSGVYFEDYFFNSTCASLGGAHLDSHNGHDHDGIGYHYHMTMDSSGYPTFPFSFGPKYYGCLRNGSSTCGSSYLDGTSLTAPTVTGTSTCGASSAVSATCTAHSYSIASTTASPSMTPTSSSSRPTVAPSATPSVTTCPTVTPTATVVPTTQIPSATPTMPPTTAPVISNVPTVLIPSAAPSTVPPSTTFYNKDYSCYHMLSWQENTNSDYNSQFSSYSDVIGSQYVSSSSRRLAGLPPPPGGGGVPTAATTMAPTSAVLATGWKMQATGIPKYNHNMTTFDMYLLNSRPKKSSDFSTGSTTAYRGELVTFGQSVGYSVTQGCTTSGYWPPGPRCPTQQSNSFVFPIDPAPETSTGEWL